jgi:glycosyltransferase involved in cell wall biosynthesis
MNKVAILIRTIGRDTLINAINSAKREFDEVIVVADRVDIDLSILPNDIVYLKCDEVVDSYGGAAINLGVQNCTKEYIWLLDDDDEYDLGAGEFVNSKITENPEVDVWIPGLRYNDGGVACMEPGISKGNIAVPTYKTKILKQIPFSENISPEPAFTDFYHVAKTADAGNHIGWYEKDIYLVRPNKPGRHGVGIK